MNEIVTRVKKEHPCEVLAISTRPITDANPGHPVRIAQETALNSPPPCVTSADA
ncbi:MAG TPA: hypothetical protein VIV12_08090 [Streptosporangiaceae bacterium]